MTGEGADGAGVAAPAEGVGQVVTNTTSSAEDAGQEVAQVRNTASNPLEITGQPLRTTWNN